MRLHAMQKRAGAGARGARVGVMYGRVTWHSPGGLGYIVRSACLFIILLNLLYSISEYLKLISGKEFTNISLVSRVLVLYLDSDMDTRAKVVIELVKDVPEVFEASFL